MTQVPSNGRFLYSAIYAFPPAAAMAFFTDLGVPLKVERGNRVFPRSDRAYDVVDALYRGLRRSGVSLVHSRVLAVEQTGRKTRRAGSGCAPSGGRTMPGASLSPPAAFPIR